MRLSYKHRGNNPLLERLVPPDWTSQPGRGGESSREEGGGSKSLVEVFDSHDFQLSPFLFSFQQASSVRTVPYSTENILHCITNNCTEYADADARRGRGDVQKMKNPPEALTALEASAVELQHDET